MGRQNVTLPALGDDAGDEAAVSHFLCEVGDEIKKGDDLVEMVTEKATFVVPSPLSGKIVSLEVDENDDVRSGDVLAVIDTAE